MPSLWITPEKSGGIRLYAEALFSKIGEGFLPLWTLPEPAQLASYDAELIHLQHEFGFFGSKLPGRYRFPKWFKKARARTPSAKWVVTAHTVLDGNWRYRTGGRGWKAIPVSILNFFVPLFRSTWMEKTWGGFDGVIVHSELQIPAIRKSGVSRVAVIPIYVPEVKDRVTTDPVEPTVLLFGYFSPEKGQDVAIRAWAALGREAPKLVLAGGVRREEDRGYYDLCVADIERFGLKEKIRITGYVPAPDLKTHYSNATLVIAPFRETSGSASLPTAFGHGAAVLTSDLPLNRELESRVPGCLAFFRAEDPNSLAGAVRELIADKGRRASLRSGALRYADTYSIEKIIDLHRAFYRQVLGGERK